MSITPLLRSLLLSGNLDLLQALLEDPALRSRAAEGVDELVSAARKQLRIAALTKELTEMGAKGVVEHCASSCLSSSAPLRERGLLPGGRVGFPGFPFPPRATLEAVYLSYAPPKPDAK